ncbi:adenosylcobinamide-phosphate synthase CbiB [Marinivivus vitaminiproducens]|uniref:adenosylcobinamide-phosphate synthase CbiB n=1 Tax=Marinivivus vitaminiproducens TaxID=3035935 RepID=UPI00279DCD68|nr:adenosylcobinamide-phosphate synthase CbiB [Geminicoccaceae bacterium SCSIO 64248]
MLLFDPAATCLALVLALVIDALLGEPAWLYTRVPHPVVAIGRLLGRLEARLLDSGDTPEARRVKGRQATLLTVGTAAVAGWGLHILCVHMPFGWWIEAALMSSLIAQRSLYQHVAAVARALALGLDEGRKAVSQIVGRDPDRLDEAAVARAAIESTAENFADGVTAPLFWGVLLGLPGLAAYKAINTADSMIGHRNERYEDFGRFAAKLDDAANLVPARLAGFALVLASVLTPLARPARAMEAMLRDASRHRSPNAGWPEAAMAGALDLRLAGRRVYGSTRVEDAWMGDGRVHATPADIWAALRLLLTACFLQGLIVLALCGIA